MCPSSGLLEKNFTIPELFNRYTKILDFFQGFTRDLEVLQETSPCLAVTCVKPKDALSSYIPFQEVLHMTWKDSYFTYGDHNLDGLRIMDKISSPDFQKTRENLSAHIEWLYSDPSLQKELSNRHAALSDLREKRGNPFLDDTLPFHQYLKEVFDTVTSITTFFDYKKGAPLRNRAFLMEQESE
jgi:hypothetical protein